MDAVRCPGCGSTDLKRKGSGFVCSWCGSTFFTTDSRAEDDYVLEDCMQDIENKHYRKALAKARKGIRLFPEEFRAWYLYTGCLCLTDGTPGDIKEAAAAAVSLVSEDEKVWQSQYIADLILDYTEAKLPQAAGRAEADAASVKADILKLGKAMGTAKAAEKVREEKECLFIIMDLEIDEYIELLETVPREGFLNDSPAGFRLSPGPRLKKLVGRIEEITEKETKILRLLDAPRDYGKRMYRLKPFSLFFE